MNGQAGGQAGRQAGGQAGGNPHYYSAPTEGQKLQAAMTCGTRRLTCMPAGIPPGPPPPTPEVHGLNPMRVQACGRSQ